MTTLTEADADNSTPSEVVSDAIVAMVPSSSALVSVLLVLMDRVGMRLPEEEEVSSSSSSDEAAEVAEAEEEEEDGLVPAPEVARELERDGDTLAAAEEEVPLATGFLVKSMEDEEEEDALESGFLCRLVRQSQSCFECREIQKQECAPTVSRPVVTTDSLESDRGFLVNPILDGSAA